MAKSKTTRRICLGGRPVLIAFVLLAFAQLAIGQSVAEGELKIRISKDGICHFLDTAIPCDGLGERLMSMRLEKNRPQLMIDHGVKEEVVDAAYKSLWRAGFEVGYVSNEIFR